MNTKALSKFLSLILRHKPETVGLELDGEGWVAVGKLIKGINENSEFQITFVDLKHVVETNDKRRFIFNDDQSKIRANQGHSLDVSLALKAVEPPEILYHGTAERFLDSILKQGLLKQNRQYVHLAFDRETALSVGARYGKPRILLVNAREMLAAGRQFFLSENKVWLTDHVPPEFLSVEDS